MTKQKVILVDKANKVADEGKKAYILEEETNNNKRQTFLNNKDLGKLDRRRKNPNQVESKNKQLKQEVGKYKSKADSKGNGVSKGVKDKLIAYYANDKAK